MNYILTHRITWLSAIVTLSILISIWLGNQPIKLENVPDNTKVSNLKPINQTPTITPSSTVQDGPVIEMEMEDVPGLSEEISPFITKVGKLYAGSHFMGNYYFSRIDNVRRCKKPIPASMLGAFDEKGFANKEKMDVFVKNPDMFELAGGLYPCFGEAVFNYLPYQHGVLNSDENRDKELERVNFMLVQTLAYDEKPVIACCIGGINSYSRYTLKQLEEEHQLFMENEYPLYNNRMVGAIERRTKFLQSGRLETKFQVETFKMDYELNYRLANRYNIDPNKKLFD